MTDRSQTQRHALVEALRMLRDDGAATFLHTAMMAVSFAAVVAALALLSALPGLPARLGAAPALTVYLRADLGDAEAAAIEARLRSHAAVAEVRRIGRDAALRDLAGSMGVEGIADRLPRNPLPDTVVASLHEPGFSTLDRLRNEALTWPNVDAALFDREGAQRLDGRMRLARTLAGAAGIVAILLALGASAGATLRWQASERPLVQSTRMPGGYRAPQVAPAVYASLSQALAAVLAAGALVASVVGLLASDVAAAIRMPAATSPGIWWIFLASSVGYIVMGGILGGVLAMLSARKHAEK